MKSKVKFKKLWYGNLLRVYCPDDPDFEKAAEELGGEQKGRYWYFPKDFARDAKLLTIKTFGQPSKSLLTILGRSLLLLLLVVYFGLAYTTRSFALWSPCQTLVNYCEYQRSNLEMANFMTCGAIVTAIALSTSKQKPAECTQVLGVLLVHDYFGYSPAKAKEAEIEEALGYNR
jgi:hypothetical protein